MLVEVKASQPAEQEPKGAKRFEFKTAERLSRLPAYFALVVVGVAAYLKSIFGVEARPYDHAQYDPRLDKPAPPEEVEIAEDLSGKGVDETTTGSVDKDRPVGAIMQGSPWPISANLGDLSQMYFVAPEFQPANVPPFGPVAVMNFPGNDNIGVPRNHTVTPGPKGPRPEGPGPTGPGTTNPKPNPTGPKDDDDDDDNGVTPVSGNRAPIVLGPVRLNDVFAGQVILIGMTQFLYGAYDPDGDSLHVTGLKAQGANVRFSSTGWLLETTPGMIGPVTFSYSITDGHTTVLQTASLNIVRKQHVLDSEGGPYVGSPYDDDILGGDGDDIIDAMDGDDHVEGGAGDDHINGGAGNDVLVGGDGNDTIFGGTGNDIIYGNAGNDRLFGEDGNDMIFGGDGDDYLDGGAGNDVLDGGNGNDELHGGLGNDILYGGQGNDILYGGEGDDVLSDGDGNDFVFGGDGDDIFIAGAGDDEMHGGDGFDTLDLSAATDDMVIDVVGGTSYSDDLGTDTFTSMEAIAGGAGNDLFIVGGKGMVLTGGKGRDTFVFEVTDNRPSLSDEVVHKILDFVVGDRVRVREYDMQRDEKKAEKNLFESVYGDDDDDWLQSDVPFIIRHEYINNENWTIILADINRDSIYDISINIQGIHLNAPEHIA